MIEWRYLGDEKIVARFPPQSWANIFSGITTEEELREKLNVDFMHGYVAYNRANTPVAFALLIEEKWRGNQVQIHGGCWSGSAWDSYTALIVLIEHLLKKGKAVRSQCTIRNVHTIRFLKSLGFVNHYTSENYRYFWLPEKRFFNAPIYRRIKKIK